MADYIGKRVGNYTITKKLGDGGFATVYLGQHTVLEKRAAVKFLLEEWVNEPEVVSRFFDEARTMERLKDHPNIVGIMDIASGEICDKEGVPPYFIMEFVDGKSMEGMIHSDETLTLEFIAEVAKASLTALEHCHKLGVVHRDIKPSNILITSEGKVKLTDFGIAKAQKNTSKTGAGLTLGSTDYMSPEQALGKRDLDHRSDIYSFGVTLYEMVVGQLPFIGDNPSSVALMHIQETPKPPRAFSDMVPEGLSNVIMKAMEKNPEDRYQSCQEMLEALEHMNDPEPDVEMDVPTVDLSTQESSLPEDQIRDDKETKVQATSQRSAIRPQTSPPVMVNAIRLVGITAGLVALFVGGYLAYTAMMRSTVTFKPTPPDAVIRVDNQIATPGMPLVLNPGVYRVEFQKEGFLTEAIRLTVSQQQTLDLPRKLIEVPSPDLLEKFDEALKGYAAALTAPAKKRDSAIGQADRETELMLIKVPFHYPSHNRYYEFCRQNDLLRQGEVFYQEMAKRNTDKALPLVLLSKFQMELNKKKEALESLNAAWSINQNDIELLNALGRYFTEQNDLERVKQYYQLSLFLHPDQPDIQQKTAELK